MSIYFFDWKDGKLLYLTKLEGDGFPVSTAVLTLCNIFAGSAF